jgi:hypothetical protein
MLKRVITCALILAVSFLLISCKEKIPTSPTTTTTGTTSTTTTSLVKPVIIRETGEGFDRIQDAIDAAEPGQHIDASGGTYVENLLVTKQVYLTGENRVTTIIKAGINIGIWLLDLARGSEIRGFTIENEFVPPNMTIGLHSGGGWKKMVPGFYGKPMTFPIGIFCDADSVYIGRNIVKGGIYGIEYGAHPGEICGVLAKNSTYGYGILIIQGAPLVSEVVAKENQMGILCIEASPTIAGCKITRNEICGVLNFNGQPDLGGGAGGSPGLNVIRENISDVTDYDFLNYSPYDIKAENNYWTHTNAAEIDAYDIYDDDNDSSFGAVDFDPFLTSPPTASLMMKPRLLYASSLFTDFFRSLFRGDLPASAIYIPSSFEPKLHLTRFELIRARYRPITSGVLYLQ